MMGTEPASSTSLALSFRRAATFVRKMDRIAAEYPQGGGRVTFQALLMECLGDFNTGSRQIEAMHLFNVNETMDDVRTSDLKYLLLDALHAQATLRVDTARDPAARVAVIVDVLKLYHSFLDVLRLYSASHEDSDSRRKGTIDVIPEVDQRVLEALEVRSRPLAAELNVRDLVSLTRGVTSSAEEGSQQLSRRAAESRQEDVLALVPEPIKEAMEQLGMYSRAGGGGWNKSLTPQERFAQQAAMVSPNSAAGTSRQDKIARFKRKREIEKSLDVLLTKRGPRSKIRGMSRQGNEVTEGGSNGISVLRANGADAKVDVEDLKIEALLLDDGDDDNNRDGLGGSVESVYNRLTQGSGDNGEKVDDEDDFWWEVEERFDEEDLRAFIMATIGLQVIETSDQIRDCVDEAVLLLGAIVKGIANDNNNNSSNNNNDNRVVNDGTETARRGPGYDRVAFQAGALNNCGNYSNVVGQGGQVRQPFVLRSAREQAKAGVFGYGHSLPTMTVEEFLDEEVRQGRVLSGGTSEDVARNEALEAERRQNQGTQADERELDDQTMRDRVFDEYKDTHPTGYGNRYNRG